VGEKYVISKDMILFMRTSFQVKCLPHNMMALYGSSILKLEHKTDNGTRSSDHSHQHHGEVRQAQQKVCYIRMLTWTEQMVNIRYE